MDDSIEHWAHLGQQASFAIVGLGGAGSEAVHDLVDLGVSGRPSLRREYRCQAFAADAGGRAHPNRPTPIARSRERREPQSGPGRRAGKQGGAAATFAGVRDRLPLRGTRWRHRKRALAISRPRAPRHGGAPDPGGFSPVPSRTRDERRSTAPTSRIPSASSRRWADCCWRWRTRSFAASSDCP